MGQKCDWCSPRFPETPVISPKTAFPPPTPILTEYTWDSICKEVFYYHKHVSGGSKVWLFILKLYRIQKRRFQNPDICISHRPAQYSCSRSLYSNAHTHDYIYPEFQTTHAHYLCRHFVTHKIYQNNTNTFVIS